jgi:peptidoglycan/xylan/chitin deacetylase (PgdA/CDA1 family)
MNVFTCRLAAKLLKGFTWHFPDEKKRIYLTFDDGPTESLTPWILHQLKRYNAKATFFCLGRQVEKFPDQFLAIQKAGHKIGNHSYSHPDGWGTSLKKYMNDIHLAAHFIHSDLFRPPHGRITPAQYHMLRNHYRIILWDILTHDYQRHRHPKRINRHIQRAVNGGSVLVFHDSQKAGKNLREVLPPTLEFLSNQGYEMASIS